MGEIVGAFGVPHNPHFPTWVEQGAPLGPEVARLYGEIAASLRACRPETLVVITSDHYNAFFEVLPIFAIGVADSACGPSDYPTLARRELPFDAELGRVLHTHLVEHGFDAAMVREIELDHTVIAPLWLLLPDAPLPIVPVFINAFIRPLPSAQRCLELGAAIRAAVELDPSAGRVAVLASGSFSLEIGGPRISETSHTGVPDPAWLGRVVELLRAGQVAELVEEATDEQLWKAGNAGGELLDWIAMLGTVDPAPPASLEVQAQFGHAFAAWPGAGADAA
ncbi:MAG: gallate dioxygenase [Gaiellales bacterium]|nr:gallate dioxygenase [Gaiellales bacterium]